MMYRLYVDYGKGYERIGNKHNYDNLITMLDHIILDKEFDRKILVIEEDKKLNSDMPIFLYTGYNIEEYTTFKQRNVKKRCL